jgi:hypothetical protein
MLPIFPMLDFFTYLVHWHQQTQRTYTKTGDETTHHDLVPLVCGRYLHNNAYANDGTPERYAVPSSDLVCDWSSDERAEQRSDGQQSYNETGAHIREVVCAVCVPLPESPHEVRHSEEARNLASVLCAKFGISLCDGNSLRMQAYIAEDTAAFFC